MATETTSSDSTTDQSVTDGQQNDGTATPGTGETPPAEQDQSQQGTSQEDSNAPKDNDQKDPQKASILADLHKERKDRQTYQAKATELETKVAELTTKAETVDAIQGKFERLEAFLQSIPGPLGKALDSRSFTEALFESDKSIDDILADWNKSNPTATSAALGAGAASPAPKGPTMNDLLRSAASGAGK
ncbi:scaffolding protein [Microbacterium phage Theresita]|nr:scaffolding protein [Microbacterium phage Theresita]